MNDNIFPEPISFEETFKTLITHFLGESPNIDTFKDSQKNISYILRIMKEYKGADKSKRMMYINEMYGKYKNNERLSAEGAVNFLITYFLGYTWYVTDPVSPQQVNVYAISDIKSIYTGNSKFRMFVNRVKNRFKKSMF